jgi:hypothetical protein
VSVSVKWLHSSFCSKVHSKNYKNYSNSIHEQRCAMLINKDDCFVWFIHIALFSLQTTHQLQRIVNICNMSYTFNNKISFLTVKHNWL